MNEKLLYYKSVFTLMLIHVSIFHNCVLTVLDNKMSQTTTISLTEKQLFQALFSVEIAGKRALHEEYYQGINTLLPRDLHFSYDRKTYTPLDGVIKRYCRLKKTNKSFLENAGNDVLLCLDAPVVVDEQPPTPKKRRRSEVITTSFTQSYKDFNSLEPRQKKNVTQPLMDVLQAFIDTSNYSISMEELLDYLKSRATSNTNQSCAVKESFSAFEATSLMHELTLTKEGMRKMRQFLSMRNVDFPTTNDILKTRVSLRPETTSVLEQRGRTVDYKELVSMTAKSILKVCKEKDEDFLPVDVKLYIKDGGDGAGSMPKLKTASAVDEEEHIFQYGIIPLKLIQTTNGVEVVKWSNPVMNSAKTLRSVFLIREKEENHELLDLVVKTTDAARNSLNHEGIDIDFEGNVYHIYLDIKDTMKDLKFKKKISGLGGADCLLYKSQQNDWTNPELIANANQFEINRTAIDTRTIFLSVIDENGNIQINTKDFETRSGVTKQPISDSDQHSITITHSYINGTSWFLKVLYRLVFVN